MQSSFECKGGIKLEPRLQEYIKKYVFCKKNNIQPLVPLEKEFGITSEDKKRIIAYKNGDRDLYSKKSQGKFDDEYDKPAFEFDPDKAFRSDPRFHRFAKKVKNEKNAIKSRYNFCNFADEYEAAFDPITALGQNTRADLQDQLLSKVNHNERRNAQTTPDLRDFRDFTLGIDSKMQQDGLHSPHRIGRTKASLESRRVYDDREGFSNMNNKNPNPNNKNPNKNNTNNTNKKNKNNTDNIDNEYQPNISFKNRIYQSNTNNEYPYEHDPRVTKIIGNMDTYRNQYENNFENAFERSNNFDTNEMRPLPNANYSNKRNLDSSGYQNMPYFGQKKGMPDMEAACAMRSKSSREQSKILHKENPFEHYFDYIDADIQDSKIYAPDRGVSTRLDNHATARPFMREVM